MVRDGLTGGAGSTSQTRRGLGHAHSVSEVGVGQLVLRRFWGRGVTGGGAAVPILAEDKSEPRSTDFELC